MSRILRRPMFRGGRVESKGDLKVVDQMGIAKLANGGMAQRPGYQGGNIVDMYESINEQIPMPERPEKRRMSTGDYLRIASAGADILGAPSEGSGIFGALRSAAPSLSKLGTDLGTTFDKRETADEAAYQKLLDRRSDIATGLTGVQSEYNIGMAKVNKKTATEINLGVVDLFYNNKIEEERAKEDGGDTIVIDKLIKDRNYSRLDIAQGGNKASKFRILSPANVELALELAREKLGEEATLEQIKLTASQFLLGLVMDFDKGLSGMANGGRVGRAEGGMMTETADVNMMTETPQGITDVNVSETETVPEQTNEINISYDQLRDRLPPEVTDDIVLLMSQSYEALADFAEIQTQADVNQFNTKYDVQLFLPQQTGA
jgi:hypothetical protein